MADKEIRSGVPVETRDGDSGATLVYGYAAVFDEETNIGGMFTEVIKRGAFAEAVGRDDVVFLINHDGLPLASTKAGTLTLREDEKGLFMEATLDDTDPDVQRIVPKMKRGDLDKMSFAFMPTRQSWDETSKTPKRSIEKAELFDVSIVTSPAYQGTDIGLRSLDAYRESQLVSQSARRLRMKSKL